ncbi:MAG: hypothetical protein JSV24_11810 [Bacteroidales bacterium]|nr:MAG: hypothetical protein JSV24_11810 [Bacteroidales bacterium]
MALIFYLFVLNDRIGYKRMHEIILIDDFKKNYTGNDSMFRLFTKKEQQQFPAEKDSGSLAGRYIIKKLIFDYLKYKGSFLEIEIMNDEYGKPLLFLSEGIKELCRKSKIKTISCSISHSRKRVTGMIVIEY